MARWTEPELFLAMELYCRIPFGRMHRSNPDVIRLAELIERTPDAVAMKLGNLASQDPAERARGIKGLRGASEADQRIFQRYSRSMERLAKDAEDAARVLGVSIEEVADEQSTGQEPAGPRAHEPRWEGPTEVPRLMMSRRAQSLFRRAVLGSYGEACAICDAALAALLQASHIVPWSCDESRRSDPTNGLALCALHDRAFDRGLITISDELRVVVSTRLHVGDPGPVHDAAFRRFRGSRLRVASRFPPDPEALRFHRENVFAS